jgi:hypothetical protein
VLNNSNTIENYLLPYVDYLGQILIEEVL